MSTIQYTKDDGTIPFMVIRDDIFKPENKQEYRTTTGDHLYYIRLRTIKKQREVYDTYCEEYYKKNQGDINPIKMHRLASEYVLDRVGDNTYTRKFID